MKQLRKSNQWMKEDERAGRVYMRARTILVASVFLSFGIMPQLRAQTVYAYQSLGACQNELMSGGIPRGYSDAPNECRKVNSGLRRMAQVSNVTQISLMAGPILKITSKGYAMAKAAGRAGQAFSVLTGWGGYEGIVQQFGYNMPSAINLVSAISENNTYQVMRDPCGTYSLLPALGIMNYAIQSSCRAAVPIRTSLSAGDYSVVYEQPEQPVAPNEEEDSDNNSGGGGGDDDESPRHGQPGAPDQHPWDPEEDDCTYYYDEECYR